MLQDELPQRVEKASPELSPTNRATMLQDELPQREAQNPRPSNGNLRPDFEPIRDPDFPEPAKLRPDSDPLDDAPPEQRLPTRGFGETFGPPRRDSSEEPGNMPGYPGGSAMGMGSGMRSMGMGSGMSEMGMSQMRMEMQKLDRATQSLRNAKDEPSRKAAIATIRDQLNAQFDRDLKRRADELTAIEERLQALQAQVQKRKDAREQIIELRLNTMINEADGLGFPDERQSQFPASRGGNGSGLPGPVEFGSSFPTFTPSEDPDPEVPNSTFTPSEDPAFSDNPVTGKNALLP